MATVTVLGDEIAAGIAGGLGATSITGSGWTTAQLCYGIRGQSFDPSCRNYVIAVGSHDGGNMYYNSVKSILNKIQNSGPSPRVIWVRPGFYANQNYVSPSVPVVIQDLYNWSKNWVPASFVPNDNSTLAQLYKALGSSTFPMNNPFPASLLTAKARSSSSLTYNNLTIANMTLYQIAFYSNNPTINNAIKGSIGSSNVSAWVNAAYFANIVNNSNPKLAQSTTYTAAYNAINQQQNTALMSVPGYAFTLTYPNFQANFANRTYIQDNRTLPTPDGYTSLCNTIRASLI